MGVKAHACKSIVHIYYLTLKMEDNVCDYYLNIFRSSSRDAYMLEFHPSLAVVSQVYKALTNAFWVNNTFKS